MANKNQILDKIARNLNMLKIANTRDVNAVVVENGSNDLTISYVSAEIEKPMGGIDGNVSPFLGMGIVNPGLIQIAGSTINTADATTVGNLLDTVIAAQVFHVVSGFANSVKLVKLNAGAGADLDAVVEGHQDLIMMGQ